MVYRSSGNEEEYVPDYTILYVGVVYTILYVGVVYTILYVPD